MCCAHFRGLRTLGENNDKSPLRIRSLFPGGSQNTKRFKFEARPKYVLYFPGFVPNEATCVARAISGSAVDRIERNVVCIIVNSS